MPINLPEPPSKGVHKNLLPWLQKFRSAILSAQPIAGQNIKLSQEANKGTLVSTTEHRERKQDHPTPPPIECDLPEGKFCPHALCFELKIEQDEINDGFVGDYVDFLGSGRGPTNPLMGITVSYNFPSTGVHTFELFSDDGAASVETAITAGQFFLVKVEFWAEGATPKMKMTVNGTSSGVENATGEPITSVLVGANFSAGIFDHREIKNVALIANPVGAEENFYFPPDSFDSVVGSGITVGGGVITINGSGNNYARKNLVPSYDLCVDCADSCPSEDAEITLDIFGVESCGCLSWEFPPGFTHSAIHDPIGINGTYTLTFDEDISGPIFRFEDPDWIAATIQQWSSSDCSGMPICCCTPDGICCCDDPECEGCVDCSDTCLDNRTRYGKGLRIQLHCNTEDGIWTLFVEYGCIGAIGGGLECTFVASQFISVCVPNGQNIDNQSPCFTSVSLGSAYLGGFVSGGQVVLTW